jgi:hypothetical protein
VRSRSWPSALPSSSGWTVTDFKNAARRPLSARGHGRRCRPSRLDAADLPVGPSRMAPARGSGGTGPSHLDRAGRRVGAVSMSPSGQTGGMRVTLGSWCRSGGSTGAERAFEWSVAVEHLSLLRVPVLRS